MAGLYVHIPFCKRRCKYCDFFSTTRLERQEAYVDALVKEIAARKDEAGEPIRTVYIGGGTPSTLAPQDIARIVKAIGTYEAEEITMELNPGDATPAYMQALRDIGINRLSIGIQSFQDDLLTLIGRRHNAQQAIDAVRMAQEAGFTNLSIDLMYALPTQTMETWQADIETAIGLGVQHISSYGLIYEDGTALTQAVEDGALEAIDEETENAMYDTLCERLKQAGFVHYEVSNFALPGYEAKHNSRYWDHTPYIGVGAGAHTYVPPVRSWNKEDLEEYIGGAVTGYGLQVTGDGLRESEILSETDLYNERIMLGLRTNRGIVGPFSVHSRKQMEEYIHKGLLRQTDDERVVATLEGIHILNRIIEDLMI